MPTVPLSGVQYSGIWTMQQVNAAIAAGTWTGLPHLYAWGKNNFGQLGLSNTTNYSSPKQVDSLTTWSKIFIADSSLAIKTDGTLWSWGRNNGGQLGFGNQTYYSSPKQVGSLTTWFNISVFFTENWFFCELQLEWSVSLSCNFRGQSCGANHFPLSIVRFPRNRNPLLGNQPLPNRCNGNHRR
jgi:hypothetical protein